LSERFHHFRFSARRLTINHSLQNNGSMWKQQACQTRAWHPRRSKKQQYLAVFKQKTASRKMAAPDYWKWGFQLGASVPARSEMPRQPIQLPGKYRMLLPCFRKLDHNGMVRFVIGIKFVIASIYLLPSGKRKL
jgi:hypothetical protein